MADLSLVIKKISLVTTEVANNVVASGPEAVAEKASMGERLAEGVMYLIPGLIIVMGLLALLALTVEFMVWLENRRKARQKAEEEAAAKEGKKKEIAWGSQIRSYVLHPYRMVKDHRTNVEVGDADRVLDGGIDPFIESWLEQQMGDRGPAAGRTSN